MNDCEEITPALNETWEAMEWLYYQVRVLHPCFCPAALAAHEALAIIQLVSMKYSHR